MSLEIPNLNRPKLRHLDRDTHLIGNVYIMVKLEKSFPNIFQKIKLKDHSSVLVFEPNRYNITDKTIEKLYDNFCLYVANRSILFSQEGMTICTLNSLSEEECMDITDPLLLKEILKATREIHRAQECKKDIFTITVGRTKANIENICDFEWYCNHINTDFEYIIDCAFESIEEQENIRKAIEEQ